MPAPLVAGKACCKPMGVRFEADCDNAPDLPEAFPRDVRKAFSSSILYAGRYTAERGARLLDAGPADLIGFGRRSSPILTCPGASPMAGR